MRIISGTFRGRRLATVGKTDIGAHLRPTTDRVRENLFNLISGGKIGNRLAKARVLDLFTGTGRGLVPRRKQHLDAGQRCQICRSGAKKYRAV